MKFTIQLAKDFDPLKAGAFGYSMPEWSGLSYYNVIVSRHPDLANIYQTYPKGSALKPLEDYFDNFYKQNRGLFAKAKDRLQKQLTQDGGGVIKICEATVPVKISGICIIGLSAIPPHIAFSDKKRIDLYYDWPNFIDPLLHELMHLYIIEYIRQSKVDIGKGQNRLFMELMTDLLLKDLSAEKSRASYSLRTDKQLLSKWRATPDFKDKVKLIAEYSRLKS
ncbi:MAG TPA: hypothetical protein VNA68_00625 [Candidatus Dormibacteraeota bacterium]|nr:hypothetical protein [Candidatus Dormibacteraeota bacterium]